MRLHDRYFFRELLTPLAYCLGGFLVFWISFFFFREMETINENKLDLLDTVEYCAASLPEFFIVVLPVLLLLALLYALTHHAKNHEITALRAAGVSLWRICLPYFAVGFIASGAYFALNEITVPYCINWSAEILNRHLPQSGGHDLAVVDTSQPPTRYPKIIHLQNKTHFTSVDFRNARARRMWHVGEYDAVTTEMVNPNVRWLLADGSARQLWATRGVRTNGVWTFFNVQLFTQAGPKSRLLPLAATNELALPEFDETPRQILLEIKFNNTQTLHGSRSADIPLTDLWAYMRHNPNLSAEDTAALQTKFQGRLAAPWTCLVVVLIAIPFGAQSGRRNLFFGVAGSIFICFAFFVLQQVSLAFGINGHLAPWLAAWLPNMFFAALGTVMILRTR
jgi:lipopolysaccharide export system permease protein